MRIMENKMETTILGYIGLGEGLVNHGSGLPVPQV